MAERTEALTQASAPSISHEGSYIDWSSILAGAVVATSIAFIFTTFGAALGLSLASPYAGEGSVVIAVVAIGLWMLWTTVSSFMAGGYITGRMRRRIDQANGDEVHIRDGIHGLTVWAVAVLVGVILLGSTADTAIQATTEVSSAVMTAVGEGASTAEAGTDAAALNEAEMKAAAEIARKTSIISAFVIAASLMIAAAAAYWAAGVGGQHRDEGRVFARFGRWT